MPREDLGTLFLAMNDETKQHSIRVAQLCRSVAKELGMDERKAWMIGLFHDVGKTKVPLGIIEKQGKLTAEERDKINWHSYHSYDALTKLGMPKDIAIPILYHHGFDKPRAYTRDENVLESDEKYIRLVGCCDVYDALTSERCYHQAIDGDKAREIISNIEDLRSDEVLNVLEQREKAPSEFRYTYRHKPYSYEEINRMIDKAKDVIARAGKQMDKSRTEIEKQGKFILEEQGKVAPSKAR